MEIILLLLSQFTSNLGMSSNSQVPWMLKSFAPLQYVNDANKYKHQGLKHCLQPLHMKGSLY